MTSHRPIPHGMHTKAVSLLAALVWAWLCFASAAVAQPGGSDNVPREPLARLLMSLGINLGNAGLNAPGK